MRGLKSMETPFIDGNKIYHNFVRPHEALNSLILAEAAGGGVGGENKVEEDVETERENVKLSLLGDFKECVYKSLIDYK
jgi:hypothetical protein